MRGKTLWLVLLIASFTRMDIAHAQYLTQDQYVPSKFRTEASVQAAISELPVIKNDSNKVALLNELGKYFMSYSRSDNSGFERAIVYLQEGMRISNLVYDQHNPNRFISQMLLGRCYLATNQSAKGTNFFQQVINHYHASNSKTEEANALFFLATSQIHEQKSKIVANYNRSIQLYRETGNVHMEIAARSEKEYYVFRSEPVSLNDKELKVIAGIAIANDCFRLALIYHRIASVNRYLGNLNSALVYSLAAVNTAEEMHEHNEMHKYLGEIAMVYAELGKQKESIEYFKKCIALREELNAEQYTIYRTTILMIDEMIKINQGDEGYQFIQSLKSRNPPHGELENAMLEHGMANCLSASGRNDLAESHFLAMLKGYNQFEYTEAKYIAYSDLVKFYVHTRQFGKADHYYKILSTWREGFNATVGRFRDVSLYLFKIDSARQRYPQAIKNLKLYKLYNDSIFNKEKSKQIEELNIRYASEKKDQDIFVKDQSIKLLTKQTELQQANLRQSKILRNSILGGSILLGLLLILLYSRYRIKIKSNLLLEKKQEEISIKNLSLQQVANEKDWLVREIHHRVKNNFHMVIGLMGRQASYIRSKEALLALEDNQHRIHIMSLIHQKLYQSDNLSTIIMTDYIHELVSFLKDSYETKHLLFAIHCEPLELDISYSLPIGLILNEAITNSIKYAFPENRQGTIEIILRQTSEDQMQLIIADNGTGIPDKAGATLHNTMGLSLIAGLSEDISGILSIRNQTGTTIQIDFQYELVRYKDISPA